MWKVQWYHCGSTLSKEVLEGYVVAWGGGVQHSFEVKNEVHVSPLNECWIWLCGFVV